MVKPELPRHRPDIHIVMLAFTGPSSQRGSQGGCVWRGWEF